MKKFLMTVLLCCILLMPCMSAQADVGCCIANFSQDYILTGNGPADMFNVATAQIGMTGEQFGYAGAWSAAFVCDTAMLAGQTDAIPFKTGQTHNCTNLLAAVKSAGGTVIYDGSMQRTLPGAVAGDLIFYGSGSTYSHVGIMQSASHSIEGNLDGAVQSVQPHLTAGAYSRITIVRPNYAASYPCTPDSQPQHFAAVHASAITDTGATISTAVNDYKQSITDCGYRLGASPNEPIAEHSRGEYIYGPSFSFDLINLSPGNTYYYQLWYIHNGITYTSDWHSFQTTGFVHVANVSLSASSLSLTMGESAMLTASVEPSNANDPSITWASSDAGIAAVDPSGRVTAIAPGTATITATASNDVFASAEVTVYALAGTPIERITMAEAAFFTLSQTLTLTPTTEPLYADAPALAWASSNTEIVIVEDGTVIPIAPGKAVITCFSAVDPSIKAECEVTIRADDQLLLPVGLTVVRANAFYGTSMQEIVLPEGVVAIGTKAFANSEALMLVHMPDTLIAIANDAFEGSENVMFLCSPKSYAANYAEAHGIETIAP